MDISNPLESFFPGAHGLVLGQMLRQGQTASGRALTLSLQGSVGKSRVLEVLDDLVISGILMREIIGKAHVFEVNRDHISYPALELLNDARAALFAKISGSIKGFTHPPKAVCVFGSIATGTSTRKSDIDILVIRPDAIQGQDAIWEDDIFRLIVSLELSTGSRVQLVEYSETEWLSLDQSQARLVKEVLETGVQVSGGPLAELRKAS